MSRRISKERFLSKVIRNPLTYVVLIFLVVTFSYSVIATYKKSKIAKQKTRQVESELQKLVDQESGLAESLNDMNTPFGVEKSLREKFGIVKDGETAIIITEEKAEADLPTENENQGFFGFLKNIF